MAFVVVINTKDDITPLRHIVHTEKHFVEEEFAEWYYDHFCKLDGDHFVYCPSREQLNAFLQTIKMED